MRAATPGVWLLLIWLGACEAPSVAEPTDTTSPAEPPAAPELATLNLAIGDSVLGEYGKHKIAIALTPADTVDFLVSHRGPTWEKPHLAPVPNSTAPLNGLETLWNPDYWILSRYKRGVHPAYVAPGSQTYEAVVAATAPCQFKTCLVPTGKYVVYARRSAPIVVVRGSLPNGAWFSGVEGTTISDTLWLRNAGNGSTTVTLSAGTTAFEIEPSTVTLHGPADSDAATPVVVRIKEDRAPGFYPDTLTLANVPQDEWHEVSPTRPVLSATVFDSGFSKVTPSKRPFFVATALDGTLLVGVFDPMKGYEAVHTIDAQTGSLTVWRDGLPEWGAYTAQVGPDSSLYLLISTEQGWRIHRVPKSGPLENLGLQTSKNFTVLPDGSVYVVYDDGRVERRSPTGAISLAHTYTGLDADQGIGIVFNPVDSALYVTFNKRLHRFDLPTQLDAQIGDNVDVGRVAAVDPAGLMYAVKNHIYGYSFVVSTELQVIDRTGRIIDRRFPPLISPLEHGRLTIGQERIYGTDTRVLWSLPLKTY